MMSIQKTAGQSIMSSGGRLPDSPCWTYCDDDIDGVPRIYGDRSAQATYGCAIGHGGDRGSLVYSIGKDLLPLFHSAHPLAFKMYPVSITENELEFIRVLFSSDVAASFTTGEECGLCRKVPYLVLPLAIVSIDGVDRGILMMQQDYSLKQFLLASGTGCNSVSGGIPMENDMDDEDTSLRSRQSFEPIHSCAVITAIAFQLVVAITALNEELPHLVEGVHCSGFTHNDIHLDNILLDATAGRVGLCDFELVAHAPERSPSPLLSPSNSNHNNGPSHSHCNSHESTPTVVPSRLHTRMAPHRLPPLSRQSPHGLFSRGADTWALALALLSLLTGVDPLFADARLMDDFGGGPLLQRHTDADGSAPVLDWDANIHDHILRLLWRDDPSGARVREAGPLLALCGKCLVNRDGARACSAVELLYEPLFREYLQAPREAERVLHAWIERRAAGPH
ncbi:uncharacterized protein TM35_000172340 [Trypanosoma theileri]|uniref:Protein kinase domain-containing protein n=1 Tax=Trypanosoma theileri TaxID=67003 RepID=A0A1X0NUL0_9TRYP|nr:uncharacterized protein TM35_000172340 [Trypanosoma theileri]ORC88362.1 hypothetical protein TM35_000172340 [Trypanosoma theileri]